MSRHRIHLAIAIVWAASIVPAWLWWRDSVLFVIVASVFANVYSAVAALEGNDDSEVLARLDRIEARLSE